jgi:hypothetical protein
VGPTVRLAEPRVRRSERQHARPPYRHAVGSVGLYEPLEITVRSFEGGTEISTSAADERRELAHRTGNGIEVTLLWTKSTNMVTIAVNDSHCAQALEFEVDADCALDAFNHPYAYAATQPVRITSGSRLAVTR